MDPWPFLLEQNAVSQESNGIWSLLIMFHANPINKDSFLLGGVNTYWSPGYSHLRALEKQLRFAEQSMMYRVGLMLHLLFKRKNNITLFVL